MGSNKRSEKKKDKKTQSNGKYTNVTFPSANWSGLVQQIKRERARALHAGEEVSGSAMEFNVDTINPDHISKQDG